MHTKLVAIRSQTHSEVKVEEAVQRSVYGLQRVNRAVIIRRSFVQLAAIVAIAIVYICGPVFGALEVSGLVGSNPLKNLREMKLETPDGRAFIVSPFLYKIIVSHCL